MSSHTQCFFRQVALPVSAAEAFCWHERPGAFQRLTPPWEHVTLVSHIGGLQDGAHVRVRLGGFPPMIWHLQHQNYLAGQQFEDVQLSGPFSQWRHTHRFVPTIDGRNSVLEDAIAYTLPLGALGEWVAGRWVRQKLNRLFAYRHRITQQDLQCYQRYSQGERPMKILVTGASGLVGQVLIPFLTTQGHEVWSLSRQNKPQKNTIQWRPEQGQVDPQALEGFDAIVHLAGENIAEGRWNADKKRRIYESRVQGTRLLAETLAKLQTPPKVLVCASAIGYYGNRGNEVLTESSAPGHGFLPQVCADWEQAASPAQEKGIRVVHMRIGMVLSPKGGALAKMLPPFQFGAGGNLGSGRQYMSWIAIDDLIAAIYHAIQTESLSGPINAVAPEAPTNAQFTKTLGKVLFRPTFSPVPAFAVRLLFGEMGDALLLSSSRVAPKALRESGFQFHYPNLESALRHILGK